MKVRDAFSDKKSGNNKTTIIAAVTMVVLLLLPIVLYEISLDQWEQRQSICLINNIFDIECYGCGITKAVIACVQIDFERAWHYNALIVVVMPLIIFLWVRQLWRSIVIIRFFFQIRA